MERDMNVKKIKLIIFRINYQDDFFNDICKKYFGEKILQKTIERNEKTKELEKEYGTKKRLYHIYVVQFEDESYGMVLWNFLDKSIMYFIIFNEDKVRRLNKKLLYQNRNTDDTGDSIDAIGT